MSKRLEILKNSLAKKEKRFSEKLEAHFSDVKSANGQPLNDKRSGHATLRRWDKQNDALRTLDESIKVTKEAIEREEAKIKASERVRQGLPKKVVELLDKGVLTQWRKYPDHFFVEGVDKFRIVYKKKSDKVTTKYLRHVKGDQRKLLQERWPEIYQAFTQK